MTKNEIYLMKKSKIIIPDNVYLKELLITTQQRIITTFLRNLESLGYILSLDVCERLRSLHITEIEIYYEEIVGIIRKMLGAHVKYEPMYPNFPRQVMEAEESELYWNAFVHYFSVFINDIVGETFIWLPSFSKIDREPLEDVKRKLRVIGLGNEEEFGSIFTQLCESNASLSETDKEILKWFLKEYNHKDLELPEIKQKETIAILVNGNHAFSDLLKTATDVLRVIVCASDGDVSLAENTKFRRFKRSERRWILSLLENIGNITEDMLRYKEVWKRLAKELHPWDYREMYPKVIKAFDTVCNDHPFETYNSKLELLLRNKVIPQAINLLETRPGIFARRLDQILRLSKPRLDLDTRSAAPYLQLTTINRFIKVADQVSTPVLLQVWHHFKYRNLDKQRVFFPKGNTAKLQIIDNNLEYLDTDLTSKIADEIRDVLVNRFSKLPSIGKVYLDKKFKKIMVPFGMRSSSKALKTISRGSRLDFDGDKEILRFFLWWKNTETKDLYNNGRVDIDLSAVFLDQEIKTIGYITYYNLRETKYGCAHSGDITSAPNGACEFIDCNLKQLLRQDVRYIVMSINSFSQQTFIDLPECFAGWMLRDEGMTGEIFEPRTVENKIDLTANTKVCIPVIIDIVNKEIIWTDLALTSMGRLNNISSNSKGIKKYVQAMVDLNRPTMYDLLSMHIEARGIMGDTEDKGFDIYDNMMEYLQ